MSRKPSSKSPQTNLMSGKGGKPLVVEPRSSLSAPRHAQSAPPKYPNPNPNHGHDPMAVKGMPKEIHNMTMGLSKQFTPHAKSVGAPGPNNQEKTGVPSFPMGAYKLTSTVSPDKQFKAFARGNSSKKAK